MNGLQSKLYVAEKKIEELLDELATLKISALAMELAMIEFVKRLESNKVHSLTETYEKFKQILATI